MDTKIIELNSYLKYRDTPWDQKIFNMNTNEILEINYENERDINKLLIQFEKEISTGLVYFRVNSNDIIIKKILISMGYYIAESSILMYNSKIQRIDFTKIYNPKIKLSEVISDSNISEIKEIARSSFKYSRFHEDPFLDIELCNKRYKHWIDDLIMQNKKILVYKNERQEIISFMFYTIENNKAKLILGGSQIDFGLISPSFFSAVMIFLKTQNIKKVEVVISFSNTVIFNLYSNLGFTIKETMFGYHKIIKEVINDK